MTVWLTLCGVVLSAYTLYKWILFNSLQAKVPVSNTSQVDFNNFDSASQYTYHWWGRLLNILHNRLEGRFLGA
jgi:hypothetical protein